MRILHLLWIAAIVMLVWGLYLVLPSRPAWVLGPPQVPLYFSDTRIVTAALADNDAQIPWIEYGPFSRNVIEGPICLRDFASGEVVGKALGAGEVCLTLDISADLRFLLAASADRKSFFIHDLLTGRRWQPDADALLRLSPRGTMVCAALATGFRLYTTEAKELLFEAPTGFELMEMSGDDSWALFMRARGAGTELLLWQRDRDDLGRAIMPGVAMQWRLAGDNRTLVVHCVNPSRVIVWDVMAGAVRQQAELTIKSANIGIALDQEGNYLAVWPLGEMGLQFVEMASGKVSSAPGARIGSTFYGFSRGGRQFAFQEPAQRHQLIVLAPSSAQVLWKRAPGAPCSCTWVNDGAHLLIQGAATSLRDGASGKEIGPRPQGVLSNDHRYLISNDVTSLLDAHKLPKELGRWIAFLARKNQMRFRVTDIATGREEIRFLRQFDEKAKEVGLRWPYVARDRFVLFDNNRVTEVWDLPPARRWAWIVGLPLAVAPLPWLRRFSLRKRPSPPAAVQTSAAAPGAV